MKSINTESLSPFGQLALKLDHDFCELERIGGQIERLAIDSDNGLERGLNLLAQFAQHGQNIAEGIQKFAKVLETSRERSEGAARIVSERAVLMQQRKQAQDQMQEKFGQLGVRVQKVSATIASFKKPTGACFSEEEKKQIPEQLKSMDSYLIGFIEEAQTIKEEARQFNLKGVERNAESLYGTLQSARRKLSSVIGATH
jgi:uncharacterized phage infection (PIP) family protein YhgE